MKAAALVPPFILAMDFALRSSVTVDYAAGDLFAGCVAPGGREGEVTGPRRLVHVIWPPLGRPRL